MTLIFQIMFISTKAWKKILNKNVQIKIFLPSRRFSHWMSHITIPWVAVVFFFPLYLGDSLGDRYVVVRPWGWGLVMWRQSDRLKPRGRGQVRVHGRVGGLAHVGWEGRRPDWWGGGGDLGRGRSFRMHHSLCSRSVIEKIQRWILHVFSSITL